MEQLPYSTLVPGEVAHCMVMSVRQSFFYPSKDLSVCLSVSQSVTEGSLTYGRAPNAIDIS